MSRARLVLAVVAVPLTLLACGLLVLLPLSLDVTGDLRELASIDADGNLTFAGVGIGTPSPDPRHLGSIPMAEPLPGDFGTRLMAMGDVEDGRVVEMTLFYEGNPLALARVAHRWDEVFRSAGARCYTGGRCFLERPDPDPGRAADGGVAVRAEMGMRYGWSGVDFVSVHLARAGP